MTKKYPKKPSHQLKTPLGEGDQTKWREIGVGWENSDGSIGIVLNTCVTIDFTRKLYLFPAVYKTSNKKSDQQSLSTGG